ncbi:MAG: EF-hand domain-containing protein [Armatimonadota bacterium]|nr:EF-hand domain-containing protein [Armatimonadota bacterium]
MSRKRVVPITITFVLAVTVALVLAAPEGAEQADPQPNARAAAFFDRHDANGDGKIERDEFQGAENAFLRMDANGDGTITPDELQAGRRQGAQRAMRDPQQMWQRMLQRFDANNDGVLGKDEFGGPERIFSALDRNADGVVTSAEAGRIGGRIGDRPAQQRGPADARARWQVMLQRFDADGDGQLSQEEWPGRPEVFQRMDPDGDGVITEQDVEALRGARQQRANPALTLIRMMDENGDGQVSADEWQKYFDTTDVNDDNMVSMAELVEQMKKVLRPPAANAEPDNE